MNGLLDSQLLVSLQGHWLQLLMMMTLSSVRVFVIFMMVPAMSGEAIPGAARNGVIYLLGGFIGYGQVAGMTDQLSAPDLAILVAKEALVGLVMGYAAASVFWIAQNIGTIIDDVAGFNSVQMNNPLRDEQSTPVSNTVLQFSIALFYTLGGMISLLGAIFESFHVWPLTVTQPDASRLLELFVTQQTDSIMVRSVKLSAPVVLLLIMVDMGIGLIARNAEKLEPSSLSQPIRGALALLLLALLVQVFVAQVQEALSFSHFQAEMQNLLPR